MDDSNAEDMPPENENWEEYGPPPRPRRVIVEFAERPGEYIDGAEQYFPEDFYAAFRENFPSLTVERLYRSLPPEEIERLAEEAASLDPDYLPPDFLARYAVSLPEEADEGTAYRLADFLHGERGEIRLSARVELPPGPQPCQAPVHQTAVAPEGVNVAHAHDAGFRGQGVRLFDLERVWDLSHPDLAGVDPRPGPAGVPAAAAYPAGYHHNKDVAHATAMLGLLAARCAPGGPALLGIAPEAAIGVGTSWVPDSSGAWVENLPCMIKFAASLLAPGDVLLLEAQIYDRNGVLAPVELEPAVWDEIRQATALGIVVIEPAGNGQSALAGLVADNGLRLFNAPIPDSGAVLVAAGRRAATAIHQAFSKSNTGAPIAAHAWGHQLITLKAGNPAATEQWGMTSGASAVIAGVAALVQSAVVASGRPPLTSVRMRDLLATGQPSPGIGHMPDLQHIVDHALANL